ncbi:NAD(P)/FAD-dependent oxidoreductase [Mycobacterium koreense]|uniref:Monooxygenase n=1 Tax=Mycolicibacillus koreensis TaxID=1069220 RepID=A0A7I7SG46_9MYCO|nr:NAD(P)/FAD-dependent oxidoreductase [Mycolicibacillus koreensis]MCV7248427.1 NAD(P)/FAD-dependent oxidoreductase [Mycolicibacillus koreensis]OSC24889.1 monooxygenase [Mycolicibacillus koreensis]BBY55371.1 pyridine nucleotide-disulfide oxidoreductase [Mycolicibacillus koreensis]
MSAQHYEAVIVGAGFGGIGAAIQLNRLGYRDLLIVDREDDLGGTWHVNHYPGLAVDIPSTTYSYWFEPNPYWSRLFAPGEELKRYAEHVADKYDVRSYMRFRTTVESARWDEESGHWQVTVNDGDVITAQFLITATGFLSQPNTPDIPGITGFSGKTVHTTAWDDDYDFTGRRVGLIGTGATAVQLIPELADRVADLTVYQRTPIWVVPKLDFPIPPLLQRLFAAVPPIHRTFRFVTDTLFELMMVTGVLRYTAFRRLNIAATDLAKMHRFASVRDKELRDKLTPDYDFGCKRPTYSNDYYRTFTRDHVHLQTAGIERIEPDGIVAADGTKTEIDTLVLATGFDLWEANFPAIEVIGRQGRNLGKWWRENRFQAYQGVSIPYFPNFLSLASPFAFSGLSFFNTMEYQMRHMDRLFSELQDRNADVFEVTEEANTRFLDRMTALLDKSVFYAGDCATSRSYYFNNAGEATLLRPTSTANAVREGSTFPLSDYTFS